MTSHDACNSGTSRVLTITSLWWLKMEAFIPPLADCEVLSVLSILNAQIRAPIAIHLQLSQQSIPAACCTKLPLSICCSENCAPSGCQSKLTQEQKAKRMESTLIILEHLFFFINIIIIIIIIMFYSRAGPSLQAQESRLQFCRRQVFHRKLRNLGSSFTTDK